MLDLMSILNPTTKITYDKVKETHNKKPKRFCFNSTHSNSLREINFENNSAKWALFMPFKNSIKKIFEKETGLKIYETRKGTFWCPIKNENEYQKALDFKKKYLNTVFLRDNLDLSIALSEHYIDSETRTKIGELEYLAKYKFDKDALDNLVNIVKEFISTTPFYSETTVICSIPPSINGNSNLPTKISTEVSKLMGLEYIGNSIRWGKNKSQLKELSFDEKWAELEKADILVNVDVKGKNIILVDDLYQSGTTLQYVAMKLKESGAKKIYGLCIVKSRKDNDNK